MIVARWKVCSWLVRRSEKSNYTHWLTYYTDIRINLVFLVRTIMFQSKCRLFAMLHLVSSFNHWFFKILYPFSCLPAICTLEFRLQFRSIRFCLSLPPSDSFFSVCVFALGQNYSVNKQASDRRKYVTDRSIKRNWTLKAILLILKKNNDAKRIMNWNYRSTDMCAAFFSFVKSRMSVFAEDEKHGKCKANWINKRKRNPQSTEWKQSNKFPELNNSFGKYEKSFRNRIQLSGQTEKK